MSGDDDAMAAEEKLNCASSCGIAQEEVDNIKLEECDSSDLEKYCSDSDDWRQNHHESEHEEACNKKREAELRDELLFKQPESSHLGDCPICMLPLPLDERCGIRFCCSKFICEGCNHQHFIREMEARNRLPKCPFCREPTPTGDVNGGLTKQIMKRAKADDPEAMCQMGGDSEEGKDYIGAFEWYTKAAELGHAEAHSRLAFMYHEGLGVERDSGKFIHHLEEAAIGGDPEARYHLGAYEWNNKNNAERAVKHWIIAAKQGHDGSIKALMEGFREGFVSKDDLAAALRAHQAAVNTTKSPQREAAEEYCRN
mmetsp:Transcript_12357/g.20357  ORF Transcript_12357/g.20357 Transcript_12357/m.20357 type:complete len:312 (+) Transcript_12357:123-1058(+)